MGETCPMICMRSIFDMVSVALSAAHASGVWFQFLPFSKLGVLGFRGVWWAAVVVGWGLIKRDAPHGPVTPVHVPYAPSFTMGGGNAVHGCAARNLPYVLLTFTFRDVCRRMVLSECRTSHVT
jgi:hypothetical protein